MWLEKVLKHQICHFNMNTLCYQVQFLIELLKYIKFLMIMHSIHITKLLY